MGWWGECGHRETDERAAHLENAVETKIIKTADCPAGSWNITDINLTLIEDAIICRDARSTFISGVALHLNGGGDCSRVCNRECNGGLGREN